MNETQASQLPVYAGNDLGAVWRSSATAFRLWAPTACSAALHRFATGTDAEPEAADLGTLAMQRSEGGTWYLELAGDLAGQYYQYELQFPDGTSTVTADPYAHAAGAAVGAGTGHQRVPGAHQKFAVHFVYLVRKPDAPGICEYLPL